MRNDVQGDAGQSTSSESRSGVGGPSVPVGPVVVAAPVVANVPAGSAQGSAGVWAADLGCPDCGYNLRGLPYVAGVAGVSGQAYTVGATAGTTGLLVDCPECGLRSDLGQLAQRRWDKPWHKAPKFNMMTSPVAWLLLGSIAAFVFSLSVSSAIGLGASSRWLAMLGMAAVVLSVWVLLLVWIYYKCGGTVGVLFSLLAHIIFVGYLGGLIMIVAGVGTIVAVLTSRHAGSGMSAAAPGIAIGAGLFIGGVILFVVGRLCEKQVAGHCIRHYLKRQTTS